ncbi:MAG: ERAP1-like C-terminal domain-containing protein [Acidobacteriia bacterium]|nr:ERAP1-like C-terminal domain-containing protein [Terriglobia bacterium]
MTRTAKTARIGSLFLILFTGWAAKAVGAPDGIPRELARQRAQQVSDVRYRLSYTLVPKAASVSGHEELRFVQNADARGILPELLDFREGAISSLTVNGQAAPAAMENGHVELPAKLLKLGENVVEIDFTAPVAPAGKAFTRFEDKDDGSEYIYTLFVPMDAEMAFPCFDQPDMKAKFTLTVTAPEEWIVISNGAVQRTNAGVGERLRRTEFAETKPISTYLFAFAAGPFQKVHEVPGMPGLYVRKSKLDKAEAEAHAVQQITSDGMRYLSEYFQQPFPFPKYDMVLLPGFAYGGMEHAGATFLREESILFRTSPTHSDRLNRDILLLHELTHQWFGDLVTMRWFDDLWLKEGFAQYMAYQTLASLKPTDNIWKRFYQAIKPAAYGIDSTPGTTPIYQEIANLKDAKSAYGAIVYSKAPGVLKQLAFVLGENKFRDGLRLYLKEHAYANAEWSDLVGALEKVSGKKLGDWANAYIRRRGMPQVDVEWKCDPKKGVTRVFLTQHDALNEGGTWPIATQVLLNYGAAESVVRADWQRGKTEFEQAGAVCPQWIFANDRDHAYGRFLLDAKSRKAVTEQMSGITDVFERTLLWGSLWDSVREAEMDPQEYVELALRSLPAEKDEALAQSMIGRTIFALHKYLSDDARALIVPKAEALAYDQMLHAPQKDMRIVWFRALRAVAETPQGRDWIKQILAGKLEVPGVEVRPLDRWQMVTGLVALNDPESEALLVAEEKRDPSGEGRKYAFVAAAARPDGKSKKEFFDGYLHDAARPEDWVEQSLGAFNWWNQSSLTLPFLKPALEALPQVKKERKIFFVLAWLNAFIGGQQSAEAQTQVQEFLQSASLDKDLKLKVLEVFDDLNRTVRIRAKYQKKAG